MRRSPTELVAPAIALGLAVAVIPFAAIYFVAHRHVMLSGQVHFVGVGLTALTAALAALVLTIAGARRRDGRTVLVGTAFTVMASLLAVHGIATPGVLIGMNGVVAFTGGATLPVGAAVLALSALPALRRPRSVRPLVYLQIVLLCAVLSLGVVGMLVPSAVPSVPATGSPEALTLLAVGLALFALLAWRAVRTFLLTRRGADLVVAVGIVWLASALPPAMLLNFMELGWWVGHGFELLGILVVGVPVALDLRRAAQSRPLVGDVCGAELVAAEEAFLGAQVRALIICLAGKDEYTEEHTRRVALRAVQVGEELGFTARRLRALATGALVHDIGKLSVPDAILQKPGPLTDEERTIFQQMIDSVHTQFIAAVADGRKMDPGKVRALADGRIYSGEQAHDLGLVDKLGGLQDAIAMAAERGGIVGEPHVSHASLGHEPWWWRLLFNFAPSGLFPLRPTLGLQLLYGGPFPR